VSPSDTHQPYDAVFLSPHLDDAILSCGGQISDRITAGDRVLIVTLFAGDETAAPPSPLAEKIERGWHLGEGGMAKRRAEDEAACRILGAAWQHWDFRDAIYRRDPDSGRPVYHTIPEIMSPPKPIDEPLIHQIAERLGTLGHVRSLFVPLSVGGHADHFLTRWAAETGVDAERLTYYEEYPYSHRPHAIERALASGGDAKDWRPEHVPVSRAAYRKQAAAVLAYRSQLRPLFKGRLLARLSLWWWWRSAHGERIWHRVAG